MLVMGQVLIEGVTYSRYRETGTAQLLFFLREFPTPVILDQARERAALRGKICDRFSDDLCGMPYPIVSRGTEGTDR